MTSSVRPLPSVLPLSAAQHALLEVSAALNRVLRGKPQAVSLAVTCAAAGGHLLLEDLPGVGKTTLAEALAKACGLEFARVQFTADLMPADVTGVQVFSPATGTFHFRPGPLFHALVLADELNRSPPRTQSALLEAMGHGQVTVDGATHALPRPFLVVATQNPLDLAGTFPLPDSQLDRFLIRMSLGHPSAEVETQLLLTRGAESPLAALTAVLQPGELVRIQDRAALTHVDRAVAEYAVRLVNATRSHPEIERGASTRAALALMAAAKARALFEAREFVTPGDVAALTTPALAHRILLRSASTGSAARDEATELLAEILRSVPAPR